MSAAAASGTEGAADSAAAVDTPGLLPDSALPLVLSSTVDDSGSGPLASHTATEADVELASATELEGKPVADPPGLDAEGPQGQCGLRVVSLVVCKCTVS